MSSSEILKWPSGSIDFTDGCVVMGILNVTPDSFSDGGNFIDTDAAVEHGIQMAQQGARIIDIGPESTRPGAEAISIDEQIKRAVPVIEKLSKKINVPISIDTNVTEVAQAALDAGASIINDITGLGDDRMTKLAAQRNVPVILMHIQGTPRDMQKNPAYKDVVTEVKNFLLDRAAKAESFGIAKKRIFIDPGIGFGKNLEHNLLLLRNIRQFVETGYRVLVGTSRKRFIGTITGVNEPSARIFGTAATVALCAYEGVSIVRVHDVAEMSQVVAMANTIITAGLSFRTK